MLKEAPSLIWIFSHLTAGQMPLMPRLKIEKIVFGVVQLRSAANIFFDCMVDGRMPAKLLSDFRIPADLPRTYVG